MKIKTQDMPLPDISLKEQQQILDYINRVHTEEQLKHGLRFVTWAGGIFIAVLIFWVISAGIERREHPQGRAIEYMNGVPYVKSADGKYMLRVK